MRAFRSEKQLGLYMAQSDGSRAEALGGQPQPTPRTQAPDRPDWSIEDREQLQLLCKDAKDLHRLVELHKFVLRGLLQVATPYCQVWAQFCSEKGLGPRPFVDCRSRPLPDEVIHNRLLDWHNWAARKLVGWESDMCRELYRRCQKVSEVIGQPSVTSPSAAEGLS